MLLRKDKAYGEQVDYFDDPNIIGFTRLGDQTHPKSGLAAIFSDKFEGEKRMYVGKEYAGEKYIDALTHRMEEVIIDEEGFGLFKVHGGSASVYVRI